MIKFTSIYIFCLYRLSEIGEEAAITLNQPRKRSNSLPIPQIEISLYQGPGSNSRDSPGSSVVKDYIEIPDQTATVNVVGKLKEFVKWHYVYDALNICYLQRKPKAYPAIRSVVAARRRSASKWPICGHSSRQRCSPSRRRIWKK